MLVLAASALVPCISSTSALSFPDLTALTILGVDVSHFRSVLVPVLPSVMVSSLLGVEAWQKATVVRISTRTLARAVVSAPMGSRKESGTVLLTPSTPQSSWGTCESSFQCEGIAQTKRKCLVQCFKRILFDETTK